MKKAIKKLLCLPLVFSMLVSSVVIPVHAQTSVIQDFSDFTAADNNIENIEFGNIPPEGSIADGLYTIKPERGVFGKSSTDTALHFISKWDDSSLPSIDGIGYINNPYIQLLIRSNDLDETKAVKVSFEIARDKGANTSYVQIRPNTADGSAKRFSKETLLNIIKYDDTCDYIHMAQDKPDIKMNYNQWSKIDVIYYPQYNTTVDNIPGKYTAMDMYVNGVQSYDKFVLDADNSKDGYQVMNGLDFIRITFDPKLDGTSYPETNTYVDNLSYTVTDINNIPKIIKTELHHSDPEIEANIDNELRNINLYGQTIGDILNGLTGENISSCVFVDKDGNTVTDETASAAGKYLRITRTDNSEDYYTTTNLSGGFIKDSVFDIDEANKRVSHVYSYTPVSMLLDGLTLEDGCSAYVLDAQGQSVSESADLKEGMRLIITDNATTDEYSINVHKKAVDENFNDWDVKMYYDGLDNRYNGYSFAGPELDPSVTPSDTAYIETANETGRGKVIHSHSDSDYQISGYSHMSLIRDSSPSKTDIGPKFVMEYSAKVAKGSNIGSQCKYLDLSGKEYFANPINFNNGNITVFNTIIGQYTEGTWYDVKAYCDTTNGTLVAFINGKPAFEGTDSVLSNFDRFSQLRVLQHVYTSGVTKDAWVDDYKIYGVGGLTESFLATMSTGLKSQYYLVDGSNINGYYGLTAGEMKKYAEVADGASVKIYESDGISEVSDDEKVKQGMILRVTTSDGGTFKNYILNIAAYSISNTEYFLNGMATDKRFAKGSFEASINLTGYIDNAAEATVVIARYVNDQLAEVKLTSGKVNKEETVNIKTSMDILDTENTSIKVMVWENTNSLKPLKASETMVPFSGDKIETVLKLYPGYVQKAVTFSYDDCLDTDTRLIEIFNKYGIKGTFNLVTNVFNNASEARRAEIKARYEGFETANHTQTHPRMYLTQDETINGTVYHPISLQECEENIANGFNDIDTLFGGTCQGLVWPYTAPSQRSDYNELMEYIKTQTNTKYIRPVTERGADFSLPEDWYNWMPNCHHNNSEQMAHNFIKEENDGELKLLYIWGHTYEFDRTPELFSWDDMEQLCKTLSEQNDMWFASNIEIHDYVEALNSLEIGENSIYNPSDIDVYVQLNGENMCIPAKGVGSL